MVPDRCPACQAENEWKEIINPFTTGIPIGKNLRICLFMSRGFGFHKLKYHCQKCGFEGEYDYCN